MKPYLPIHRKKPVVDISSEEELPVIFPTLYSNKAIGFYIAALVICNLLFSGKFLSPLFWVSGIFAVYCFFSYSSRLSVKWSRLTTQQYEKKLFWTALGIRLVWVLISYVMYNTINGQPFEWGAADALFYHDAGSWIVDLLKENQYQKFVDEVKSGYSDLGYATYLGLLYTLTGKYVLAARLLKALYGAITVLLLYRLAKRTFGEKVGRLGGLFVLLMPNLILYCGLHTKENEMVFLTVVFLERSDALIRGSRFSFTAILLPLLAVVALFFFRTVLAVTAIFALVTTLMLSRDKILNFGRRALIIVWVLLASSYFVGGKVMSDVEALWNARNSTQEKMLDFRASRANGNKLAKYAGGAVFAPMIFVIPFPTVVGTPGQENQQFINGGNFVKNVLAFFMLLAVYDVIKKRKWRDYLLIGSFVVGYLGVLAMSSFAQSERFHQPVLPFELIIAAYGFSVMTNKLKKWFGNWMILLVVIMVAWSWFKLAGRGMA